MGEGLKASHSRGIVFGADHENSFGFHNNESVQSANGSDVSCWKAYEVVCGVVEEGFGVNGDVVAPVDVNVGRWLWCIVGRSVQGVSGDALPCPEVGPSEVASLDVVVPSVLEHGKFHREVRECCVELGGRECCKVVFVFCQLGEHVGVLGHMFDDIVQHIVSSEDEEAGVPEEFAAVHKHLCEFLVRFFGEGFYVEDLSVLVFHFSHLYVAVSSLGSCRLYSESHDSLVVADVVECLEEVFHEYFIGIDDLVRRRHCDARLRIYVAYGACSPGYGSERASSYGFCKYLLPCQLRELLLYDFEIVFLCAYKDVLGGYELCEALICLLNQSQSGALEIEKLLGHVFAACGPKSAS